MKRARSHECNLSKAVDKLYKALSEFNHEPNLRDVKFVKSFVFVADSNEFYKTHSGRRMYVQGILKAAETLEEFLEEEGTKIWADEYPSMLDRTWKIVFHVYKQI